jgi:hypothetical protein
MKFALIQLADKFKKAGFGQEDSAIVPEDLEKLGLNWHKSFKSLSGRRIEIEGNWENLCAYVHEKLTGKEMPRITAMGVGFRSQAAGENASNAILEYVKSEVAA